MNLPRLPGRAWRPLLMALAAWLAGCVASSPPVQLYQLRAAPPVAVTAPAAQGAVWHLVLPVRVPEVLDREALLLPQGSSGLLALSGHRWAESLRDSVPRLLRQDLATLLGEASVWATPLPAAVQPTRQLRVELLALQARADRRAVELRARWSVLDVDGGHPPRAQTLTLDVPSSDTDIDSLVAAHRLALWRLAERIAATP